MKKRNNYFWSPFFLFQVIFVLSLFSSAQGQSFDDLILEKLDIKEGMIVADIGAGNGKFSVRMAQFVGLDGHVYANEIDEDSIQRIKRRIEDGGVENITLIYGEEEDAVLPVAVDFMVLKFVYHHLSNPEKFMTNLLKYLKPGGHLAVIAADINHGNSDRENREERDPCVSDPEKTKKAVERSGFQFVKREDVKQSRELDYILIFKAADRNSRFADLF